MASPEDSPRPQPAKGPEAPADSDAPAVAPGEAWPADRESGEDATESGRLAVLRLADAGDRGRLPDRYRLRQEEEGLALTCLEAPSIRVRVERGFSTSASAARGFAAGTIFLDGAAAGPPFLDPEKAVFNLDHHEGCVRSFTLSTCEQAFVLVAKGLDLQSREWTVYANEPDLDTLLAIWVLLNHRRLRNDERLRRRIVPLLRLEGVIDVHGFDLRELCGFPATLERQTYGELETIGQPEIDARREGRWEEVDFPSFTAERMRLIDSLVYRPEELSGQAEVEELARAELPERRLVVGCRADVGIYTVEEHLRAIYGDRLGVIVLQKTPQRYTLRQVDSFLGGDLERVYGALNLFDPAAGNSRSADRWGGSTDIGGSPRSAGTSLSLRTIVRVCARAFERRRLSRRAATYGLALALSALVAGAAALPFMVMAESTTENAWKAGSLALSILALTTLTLGAGLWRGPGVLGLRRPVGLGWLPILPLAILAAAGGGAWALVLPGVPLGSPAMLALAVALGMVAEAFFRGVLYGTLLDPYRPPPGSWRPSLPLVASSVLYAGASLVPTMPLARRSFTEPGTIVVSFVAALVFGFACGYAREQSESLLPPLLFHALAVVVVHLAGLV